MNAGSADILNLLLGIAPANTGNAPVIGDGAAEGPSFDMLFGALVQGQGAKVAADAPGLVNSTPQQDRPNDPEFDLLGLISKPPDKSVEGLSAGQPEQAVEAEISQPAITEDNPTTYAATGTESDGKATPFRVSPLGYEAARIAATGAKPIGAPHGFDGASLDPGRYAVLDWSRNGDTLTLEVAPVDEPTKTIKISIPAGRMQLETSAQPSTVSNAARRVALDGESQARSQAGDRLSGLFEKLNVKELVVKAPQQQAADAASPQSNNERMELRLFAENAGQQVMLRTSLARDVVRTHLKQEGGVRMEQAVPKMSEGVTSHPTTGTTPTDTAPHATAAVRTGWDLRFGPEKFHEFPTQELRVGNADAEPKSGSAGMPDFMRSTTELTADRQGTMVPRGRFTLPDEARMTLRPNGRSVQLKIDPEHLGPARLSLTINNDHLRALVVVDSPHAKQTVEASLDRLIDTLARADIKVDAIDVEVNQHGADERLFEQHASHGRGSRLGRFANFEPENELTAEATHGSGASRGAASYLGTGGVNVLA